MDDVMVYLRWFLENYHLYTYLVGFQATQWNNISLSRIIFQIIFGISSKHLNETTHPPTHHHHLNKGSTKNQLAETTNGSSGSSYIPQLGYAVPFNAKKWTFNDKKNTS